MASSFGFTFGGPVSPCQLDLPTAERPTADGCSAVPAAGLLPIHRLLRRRTIRKRRASPAGGVARKRRADEESVIGDLRNLTLSGRQRASQSQWRFQRWRELETSLADQLASEEQEQCQPPRPRVVLSDELQGIISSPARDLMPDTQTSCTALVLWRPPPCTEPPEVAERPPSPPSDAAESQKASLAAGVGSVPPVPAVLLDDTQPPPDDEPMEL